MNDAILILRKEAALVERNGVPGLALHGTTRFAANASQADILRALLNGGQPLETILRLLCARAAPKCSDVDANLAMAAFILDFGDFLET